MTWGVQPAISYEKAEEIRAFIRAGASTRKAADHFSAKWGFVVKPNTVWAIRRNLTHYSPNIRRGYKKFCDEQGTLVTEGAGAASRGKNTCERGACARQNIQEAK